MIDVLIVVGVWTLIVATVVIGVIVSVFRGMAKTWR